MTAPVASEASVLEQRRDAVRLALIVAIAFALRLAYLWFSRRGTCADDVLITHRKESCPGDAYVYHYMANLFAEGKGFITPTQYYLSGGKILYQAADHPPLLIVLLAGLSFLGFTTFFAHQLVTVVIGTASVAVAGLLGRDVFGSRVGLVAACLAALYPYMWLNDGNVLSEGLTILLVLLVAWAAYRFWRHPSWGQAAWLGAACGAAALSRPETALLVPLLGLPMALGARALAMRDRVLRFSTVVVVAALVVGPWVGYNLVRFNNPVTLSTGFGYTLSNTNCDETYYGNLIGYWHLPCVGEVPSGPHLDQSDDERFLRDKALDYIKAHTKRFLLVVLAREGRMWNLFRPLQQTHLDVYEGRPLWANRLALAAFYPVMVLAIGGIVVARRRRIPVLPLVVPIVIVILAGAVTFGHARYRASTEGTICVLAALGIDGLVVWWRSRRERAVTAPASVRHERAPAGAV